jgi:hypothetical protein
MKLAERLKYVKYSLCLNKHYIVKTEDGVQEESRFTPRGEWAMLN